MRVYKEFTFEAAHLLPSAPPGHPNARVHGHSFRVRVTVDGEPNEETGVVIHFDDLEAATADVRDALDHRFLNDLQGLAA
ncbi:MAG TPA: 6-carboxytetrahydropterin synthase, partial [Methyloceanibacter sp.]